MIPQADDTIEEDSTDEQIIEEEHNESVEEEESCDDKEETEENYQIIECNNSSDSDYTEEEIICAHSVQESNSQLVVPLVPIVVDIQNGIVHYMQKNSWLIAMRKQVTKEICSLKSWFFQ